jgi:hypothetical protein
MANYGHFLLKILSFHLFQELYKDDAVSDALGVIMHFVNPLQRFRGRPI